MPDTILTFVHISDTHISDDPLYNLAEAEYIPSVGAKALVSAIQELPFEVDFILHTGDVAYDPHESAYDTVKEIFKPIDTPIYYIAGNHDHNQGLQRQMLSWSDDKVMTNLHYEFEVNGVQIVCVDSNGPAEVPAGNVPQEQLNWLETICTADDTRPLIIAIHHNPLPVGVPWLDNWMRITNGLDFHNIVKKARSRLIGVFHGHIHQNTSTYREGILYSSTTSSWTQLHSYPAMADTVFDKEANPGFSVVIVKPNQSFIRRYAVNVPSA